MRFTIVARVIVNRIWQHYFGRGIVPTPDDFGHLGLPPSHPELLDWLATELVAHDWSLKHIHRLILTSSTYRMGSGEPRGLRDEGPGTRDPSSSTVNAQPSTRASDIDPGNTLLWRMNVKRLEGEIIRDAILQLSGRLDDTMYGRSVPVHLTAFLEGRGRPGESGPVDGRGRRSLYIAVRRNFVVPCFQAFDFPGPHSTIGRRNVSNVPAQALALMNNPLVVEQAQVCARRVGRVGGNDIDARLAWLHLAAFSRSPTPAERERGRAFIEVQAADLQASPLAPAVWAEYVHALWNAKEFSFIP